MCSNHLALLRVVAPIDRSALDHVATSCLTASEVWRELINNGHPEETASLRIIVPGQVFNLKLTTYRNRGGITNKNFREWLRAHNYLHEGVLLLFDVTVDNGHNVCYIFKGQIITEQ